MKTAEIIGWNLRLWIKGKKRAIDYGDLPDDVSQPIDDFLTELEKRLCPKCGEEMICPDPDEIVEGGTLYWYCGKCKKNIRKVEDDNIL